MAVSYASVLYDLFVVFGVVNALVFLHVGAPFRRLLSGTEDMFWKINIKSYNDNVATRASYVDKPWERFQLLCLGRFAHCHACMGFWIGSLQAFWMEGFNPEVVHQCVAFGFLSSAFCFVLWVVLKRLGADKL